MTISNLDGLLKIDSENERCEERSWRKVVRKRSGFRAIGFAAALSSEEAPIGVSGSCLVGNFQFTCVSLYCALCGAEDRVEM